jgi:hypothetical protein
MPIPMDQQRTKRRKEVTKDGALNRFFAKSTYCMYKHGGIRWRHFGSCNGTMYCKFDPDRTGPAAGVSPRQNGKQH